MASAAATDVSGGLFTLALAMVLFVGSHLLLSARPLRAPLVARLGERSFRIVYSVISSVCCSGWPGRTAARL
ncbi:MAG: hypothetical protein HWD60_06715 [Defluviicoccus sp.]|nr:MAG: hypothetical protein HWD60_06715 [Defluviicoccus sp.]